MKFKYFLNFYLMYDREKKSNLYFLNVTLHYCNREAFIYEAITFKILKIDDKNYLNCLRFLNLFFGVNCFTLE